MFDPARTLTKSSPGVLPEQPVQIAFSPYDPEDVHKEIIESWGEEPLAPLTWATDFPQTSRRKRRRKKK